MSPADSRHDRRTVSGKVSPREIVDAALSATTAGDVDRLVRLLREVGASHHRPVGDRYGNFGLITQAGDYDYRLLEQVTNAQDAVLEALARRHHGDVNDLPYTTPHEAAAALTAGEDYQAVARRIRAEIHSAGDSATGEKRITFTVRDQGIGITSTELRRSLFMLGSSRKSGLPWLQGAFGVGGISAAVNADALIVVSRRDPALVVDGVRDDRIVVAVARWIDYGKGRTLVYLTTTDWADGDNPEAEPWSVAARDVPDFEPGTHVALVGYVSSGLHRGRSGDEKSFDTIFDTRLLDPVSPVYYQPRIGRGRQDARYLRGLSRRLDADDFPGDTRGGPVNLPFRIGPATYSIPIRYHVFNAPSANSGARKRYVAAGHAVVFISNGQVHHHWDGREFATRTGLNKLADRVLVVVDTDALPIGARTALFTPDRAQLQRSDSARRLQEAVGAFLAADESLNQVNRRLIVEEVSRSDAHGTRAVADRISRSLRLGGFGSGSTGTDTGPRPVRRVRPPCPEIGLLPEPTVLDGPRGLTIRPGQTRPLRLRTDAVDSFFIDGPGSVTVTVEGADITQDDIIITTPVNGAMVVLLAAPEDAALGEQILTAAVQPWTAADGTVRGPLTHTVTLLVTDEPARPRPAKPKPVGPGHSVALLWKDRDDDNGLTPSVPGIVEDIPAETLAARPEYADLAALGDTLVPTVVLNNDYAPLHRYLSRLSATSGHRKDRAKERYAQSVGLGLLLLRQHAEKVDALAQPDPGLRGAVGDAIARSALSLLPDFDTLMTGLEEVGNTHDHNGDPPEQRGVAV